MRYRKKDLLKIFGYIGGIASIVVLLFSLLGSIFFGYKLTIYTNHFSECFIEIFVLSVLLVCVLYSFYSDFSKKEKVKNI